MKRKLLMVVLAFAFVLSIGLMVACADKGDDPVTGGDITLTVENVPKTGMVGREVKLPAASASDSKEGDLTDRVKLNVDLLKADGTTSKQILFRVAANKEQKFTPSGNELLDYKITYSYPTTRATPRKSNLTSRPRRIPKPPCCLWTKAEISRISTPRRA